MLLMISHSVMAGDYYNPSQIDTYDPSSGLYFKAVEKAREDRGFMSSKGYGPVAVNINVFDPASGKSWLLFNEPVGGMITAVIFESGYKDGSIEFGGQEASFVKNNKLVPSRDPKGKVLVAIRSPEKKETTLLVADKRSGNPTPVATVADGNDWHIDVKNSKIRVVHQTGQAIKIDSYEW
jgi:hypothetical protein